MSQMIIIRQMIHKEISKSIIKKETSFNINFQKTIKIKIIITIIKKMIIKKKFIQGRRFKVRKSNKLRKDNKWSNQYQKTLFLKGLNLARKIKMITNFMVKIIVSINYKNLKFLKRFKNSNSIQIRMW